MNRIDLADSELKVMAVLWERGELPARRIASELETRHGWNINTTYTLIKRCVGKGAVLRSEPNFMCKALVRREEIQRQGTRELVDKIFGGSVNLLFASLLGKQDLSDDQVERLKRLADEAGTRKEPDGGETDA